MRRNHGKSASGFSLIELVIVVVIIGIIGAIAIPRMSRGSEAAQESALKANLSVLRNAVELYYVEHNGAYPTAANIEAQLTGRTNLAGAVADENDDLADFPFGPYLRAIPPIPVGDNAGEDNSIGDGDDDAWQYDETTGEIIANVSGFEDL